MTLVKLCFHRTCSKWVDLKENDYKVAEYFDTEAEIPGNAESIRQRMFLHFATQENLPHRLAYDNKDFYFVSNTMLEKKYMEPLVDETSEVKGEPKKTSGGEPKKTSGGEAKKTSEGEAKKTSEGKAKKTSEDSEAAAKSIQITEATDSTSRPRSVVTISQV